MDVSGAWAAFAGVMSAIAAFLSYGQQREGRRAQALPDVGIVRGSVTLDDNGDGTWSLTLGKLRNNGPGMAAQVWMHVKAGDLTGRWHSRFFRVSPMHGLASGTEAMISHGTFAEPLKIRMSIHEHSLIEVTLEVTTRDVLGNEYKQYHGYKVTQPLLWNGSGFEMLHDGVGYHPSRVILRTASRLKWEHRWVEIKRYVFNGLQGWGRKRPFYKRLANRLIPSFAEPPAIEEFESMSRDMIERLERQGVDESEIAPWRRSLEKEGRKIRERDASKRP